MNNGRKLKIIIRQLRHARTKEEKKYYRDLLVRYAGPTTYHPVVGIS